ncbi:MAG: nucleotide exchange factor GrpE, partial [Actinomycetota bacterium]|nr:nucleotide exchange factor GrpE [Actinomycetota bacterium]
REESSDRARVKVTDRRRVHVEDEAPEGATPAKQMQEQMQEQIGPPESAHKDTGSELEKAKAKAAEYLDHLRRLQAEFANYRKRTIKEQTRTMEAASEPLVQRLLEVLDDFELALMAAEKRPDFDKFLHGVELVYAKLLESLRNQGLERIDARGKPFDPERHEALMQSGEGDGEPVVDDVLRQGYTLKGRVIRPAGVRVSRS